MRLNSRTAGRAWEQLDRAAPSPFELRTAHSTRVPRAPRCPRMLSRLDLPRAAPCSLVLLHRPDLLPVLARHRAAAHGARRREAGAAPGSGARLGEGVATTRWCGAEPKSNRKPTQTRVDQMGKIGELYFQTI